MSINVVGDWYSTEPAVTNTEWQRIVERLLDDMDISYDLSPNINSSECTVHEYEPISWSLSMPANAISRIQTASSIYDEFNSLIRETADTILGGETFSNQDLAYVGWKMVEKHLKGEIDIEKLIEKDYSMAEAHSVNPPEHPATITVTSVNQNNRVDWMVYSIDDPTEFFDGKYGSSSLMFHTLLESDVDPTMRIDNVVGSWEDNSVTGINPPKTPIVLMSVDGRSRISFTRVDEPETTFGTAWGNIDEMVDIYNNRGGKAETEHIAEIKPDWKIKTGIRW